MEANEHQFPYLRILNEEDGRKKEGNIFTLIYFHFIHFIHPQNYRERRKKEDF